MAYHDWSETTFDWSGLSAAENDLTRICRRYGRLGGQSKEKFGQLRFYASFSSLSLHALTHPGWHHYAWYPKWLISIDHKIRDFTWATGLTALFNAWQRFVYKHAYRYILKKYPTLREEIGSGADYPELFAHFIGTELVTETDEETGIKSFYRIERHYYKDGTFLCGWRSRV